MLYLLRTALSRDLGGMGNIRLYKHTYIGTKNLIERYIDSALETIRSLVKIASSNVTLPDGLETKDVLEQVVYARQAFGRSALLLSGGATFGMNHIGVLKALFEAHLLPRIISGASAGSIVASVLCTRTDEELPVVLRQFPYGNLAVFEERDRPDGVLERLRRFLTEGAWIDIKYLTGVMRELLGDMTFQEAYNRSRRILNICVSSASVYELPRLLNYITSPNVMIWSAVAASCSVPLIFSATPLLVKNPLTGQHCPWNPTPQKWIDGSVDNDLPMTRLAEMFNVNHFIVSQVNPHVIPFLARDEDSISHLVQQPSSSWDASSLIYTMTDLAKGEALHRLHVLAEMGIFPNLVTKARSILSQKYSGDITILPEINLGDMPRMLKNPTTEFMCRTCLAGERATWPKLSRIRNHCAVELELDLAVQQLRARVVFSPSQVDLRRLSNGIGMLSSDRGRGAIKGSSIRGRPRRDSGGKLCENGSSQRKLTRPPIGRAASHHGPHRKAASTGQLPGVGEAQDESTLQRPSIHTLLPRNKTITTLSIPIVEQTDGNQDPGTDAPRAKNLFNVEFPTVVADYFSGLESEATQDESMSPISGHRDSSDGDMADVSSTDDFSTDPSPGNETLHPNTSEREPQPELFLPELIQPKNSLGGNGGSSQDPTFYFASQSTTPRGGAVVPTPVLSPLLCRERELSLAGVFGEESRTEPSSPERTLRRLSHGSVAKD